jgi:hypothetical protein
MVAAGVKTETLLDASKQLFGVGMIEAAELVYFLARNAAVEMEMFTESVSEKGTK